MQHRDLAVSPVVGVMLMLVVTIVIAAVVSAFAGGMATDQHKTPQVTLGVKSVIQSIQGTINPDTYAETYPPGFTAANGIQFENTGGDTFSLNDIEIQLQSEDTKYTIKPTDTLPTTSILTPGITNGGYFQKIGNTSLSDRMIAPGDKFMLYADGCAGPVTYTFDHSSYGPKISWKPQGTSGGLALYLNKKVQYAVFDKVSSRVMAKGELILT
jgi:Uncharacterized protein conserved in archaea